MASDAVQVDDLIHVVVRGDEAVVCRAVKASPALATAIVARPVLVDAITHWVYASDTLLHVAAAAYRTTTARMLIDAGADPNAANRRGATPLHYAADGHSDSPHWDPPAQVRMIDLLIESGAAIDTHDKNGATPLHRAVRTRCAAAVTALCAAGAEVDGVNKSGSTALHLAVQTTGRGGSGSAAAKQAQRDIVATLRKHGASLDKADGNGRSARDIASDALASLLR